MLFIVFVLWDIKQTLTNNILKNSEITRNCISEPVWVLCSQMTAEAMVWFCTGEMAESACIDDRQIIVCPSYRLARHLNMQ